jgi:hypothetical protein
MYSDPQGVDEFIDAWKILQQDKQYYKQTEKILKVKAFNSNNNISQLDSHS